MIVNPVVIDMDVGETQEIPMEVYVSDPIDMEVGTAIQIVSPNLEERTVTPTQSVQTLVPDAEFDGFSQVIVNPIPSNYGLVTWNGSALTVS